MKNALSPSQRGSRLGRGMVCTLGLAIAAWTAMAGGCYERVIRATGPGVDRVRVEEPYQQNYEVDEWLFGNKVKDVERRP